MTEPRRKPAGMKPLPKWKATLVCDRVILDALNGERSLIGIFENFNLPTCPCQLPPFWALSFTDMIGRNKLTAEVHDQQERTVIAAVSPGVVGLPYRSNRMELSLLLPPRR